MLLIAENKWYSTSKIAFWSKSYTKCKGYGIAAPAFSDGQESDGLGYSIIFLYSKVLSLYNCAMIAIRYNHSNRVMTTSAIE